MARMIVSRKNRWIKDIRRLRRSKGDRALLEGPHLIAAARDAGLQFEVVLASPDYAQRPDAAALLDSLDPPAELVLGEILDAAADSDSPRGLIAIARVPRGGVEALPPVANGVYLFADGLQEPGNLGALARVAEAAGVAGLALAEGSAHPNHPRALRASAGSLLRLPVARETTAQSVDARLAAALESAPTWLALVPRDGEPLYDAELPASPLVLAVGAEGPGLGPDTLGRAERRLTLPMRSPVESLNVTVAAALAVFEIARRRAGAGPTASPR